MSKSERPENEASLNDFQTAAEIRQTREDDLAVDEEKKPERPNWEPYDTDSPDTGAQVKCTNCENWVVRKFSEIFGDENGKVSACPECATYREIAGLDRYGDGAGLGGGGL